MEPFQNYNEQQVLEIANTAYHSGVATFPLTLEHTALLVIDMQAEFVRPNWSPYWVPEATRLVPRLVRVVEAARRARVPVIHTAFAATNHYLDRPRSGEALPNRYAGDNLENLFTTPLIVPELAPLPEEVVILKPSYGAFYDTPLDTILRNLQCNKIIITGTLTNLCCSTTARQAYERGYQVFFGADLTATNNQELHEAELKTLRYGFAKIVTSTEILEKIEENI
jgi:nicotinamidase-related amidase